MSSKRFIFNKLFISFILAIALVLTLGFSSNVFAESIVQNGSISWRGHKVGDFTLGGRQAFCVDHKKSQPASGTWYDDRPYDNGNIRKTLYFGWAGEEQWSGFNGNRAKGIVTTTMLLNYYMNGGNLSSDFYDFKNFVESQPEPTRNTNFSRQDLDTHIEGNIQRTDTISIYGSNMPLKFWVDNDITLVNDNNGARYSNCDVELRGGDRVHFEAPLTLDKNYSRGDIECRWQYPAILSSTSNSSIQRIARLGYKEPAERTHISVHFKSATGSLKVRKEDAQTGAGLPGAKLNLFRDNDNSGAWSDGDTFVASNTTDANGYAKFENVVMGDNYLIEEMEAPYDYNIDKRLNGPYSIKPNETTSATLKDTGFGYIEINKTDKDFSNIKLQGAVFEIYNDKNKNNVIDNGDEKVDTLTTNENGYAKSKQLIITSQYLVKEVKAPKNYSIVNSSVVSAKVETRKTTTLNFTNNQDKFRIEIIKVNKDNHRDHLGGTEFQLISHEKGNNYSFDGQYVKFTSTIETINNRPTIVYVFAGVTTDKNDSSTKIYTNENGKVLVKGLRVASYDAIETKANEWYKFDEDAKYNFEPEKVDGVYKKDVTLTKIVENTPKKGKVTITKKDGQTNEPLKDVEFEVRDDKGAILETIKTDANGQATTKEYALQDFARLHLIEVKTGDNYVLKELTEKEKTFDAVFYKEGKNAEDTKAPADDVTIRKDDWINIPKSGWIKVVKTDEFNGKPISGVEFSIYEDVNKNGKFDYEDVNKNGKFDKGIDKPIDKFIDTITTKADGTAATKDYSKLSIEEFKKLSKEEKNKILRIDRDYILIETKKDNRYEDNNNVYKFNTKYREETLINVTNKPKTVEIRVTKRDEDERNLPVQDVEFTIYEDTNGNGKIDAGEKVIDVIKTDKNGINTSKSKDFSDKSKVLRADTKYILKETKSGKYYLDEQQTKALDFTKYLDDKAYNNKGQYEDILLYNKPQKGRIKVVKVDEFNNRIKIQGVVFKLYEDTNNNGIVDDGDKYLQDMTTDKDGIATSNWYRIARNGKKLQYLVIETSAPSNYVEVDEINAKARTLKFNLDWNKTQEKYMENCPKTIEIKVHKTIKGTDIPLKDISFEIYKDLNGNGKLDKNEITKENLIDIITTDKDGYATSLKYSKDLSLKDKQKVLRIDTKYLLRENTTGITLEEENIVPLDFTKFLEMAQKDIPVKNIGVTNHIEVKPVKKDEETRKPLENATYDIYEDINNNGKIDKDDKKLNDYTFTTDKNGDANIKPLPFGNYIIIETKAPEGYNLNKSPTVFKIDHEGVYNIDLFDTIISTYVDIFKTTKENSDLLNIKKGEGVPDTYFSIYEADDNGKLKLDKDGKPIFAKGYIKDEKGNTELQTLGEKKFLEFEDSSKNGYYYVFNTGKDGHVAKVRLLYGKYIIREVKSNPHFLNDSKDILFKVSTPNDEQKKENKEVVLAAFNNTPHKLKIHIQKEGLRQAQPNDVIRYDFPDISNRSNVKLYNFTWEDNLPYDYVKIQKLYTGVWNEDHTFKVYYKTNKHTDWILFGEDYSNQKVNLIDFESLELDNVNEYVTDFKIVFDGAVKEDFAATETPFIMTKVDSDVKATDIWTNRTKDYGWDWDGEYVEDSDDWETTSYHQELKITNVLPRTGTEHNYILYVIAGNILALSIIAIKKRLNK